MPQLPIPEEHAVERLAVLWNAADRPATYPCFDTDLFALAAASGYELDADGLEHLVATGMVRMTTPRGGPRRWAPRDICAVFAVLELLRRWIPGHTLHAAKMTAAEVEFYAVKARGEDPFDDLNQHPTELLLAYLVRAADPCERVAVWLALREKLSREGSL